MGEIALLSLTPGRLCAAFPVRRSIGGCTNHIRDARSEATDHLLVAGLLGFVFEGVVKQGGDGLILRATIALDDSANAEEVSHDRDRTLLARVVAVKGESVLHRVVQPLGHG